MLVCEVSSAAWMLMYFDWFKAIHYVVARELRMLLGGRVVLLILIDFHFQF